MTERTREIGIRKAVGAKRRDILSQFMTEAMMLSIAGGGIGLVAPHLQAADGLGAGEVYVAAREVVEKVAHGDDAELIELGGHVGAEAAQIGDRSVQALVRAKERSRRPC